jgi:hypothetical protein
MPYSLAEILTFNTIDLNNFKIRGARTGTFNAQSTGPLYTEGDFIPSSTILTANASYSDSTLSGIKFDAPYDIYNTNILVIGDTVNVGSQSYSITSIIDSSSVAVE